LVFLSCVSSISTCVLWPCLTFERFKKFILSCSSLSRSIYKFLFLSTS
jgi:hypothetical protein